MRFFHSRPESVPEALRAVPQWLAYRAISVLKPDGSTKLNKIPVNPRTGRNGKSNDPATWGTFAEACEFVRALPDGTLGGLGYAFTPGAGITAIDLDHCLGEDGELHPAAAELIAAFDSWTEMSPSGNGVHIWIRGTLEGVTSAKYAPGTAGFPFGVEIFCDRFFMTVTGIEPAPGKAIEDRQSTLRDLYRRLEAAKLADAKQSATPDTLTDIDRFEATVIRGKLAPLNPGKRETATGTKGDAGHKWIVQCPWADRHTGGGAEAAVFSFGGMPSFKCLHTHCADKTYADLADKYDLPLPSYVDEYNRDHALVLIEGRCRVIREGTDAAGVPYYDFLKKEDFLLYHANKSITIKTGAGKTANVQTAPEWLRHPKRRTYCKVTFDPARKQDLPGVYNMFRGFGENPAAGAWNLMEDHIRDVLCSGDDALYRWVMSWCARIVQDPGGERPGTAIVLRGGQGVGKGMFAVNLGRIIGPHFRHLTHQEQLTRAFNAHLKDALLVFADEACYPGDKAAVGRLKGMITEPTLTIEPKGVDAFQIANHINLIMATNEAWAIPAEMDSRRFLVLEVGPSHKNDRAYFAALQAQMDNGGRAAWMAALQAWDWRQVDLRTVPATVGLRAQKVASLPPIGSWWHEALEAGAVPLADNHGDLIGGVTWPSVATKSEVYAGFVRYCKTRNVRHIPAASELWKACRGWGWADAPTQKGERCMELPDYDAAVKAWDAALGGGEPEDVPF